MSDLVPCCRHGCSNITPQDHPVLELDGSIKYMCQACKDRDDAETLEIDKLRKAGRLRSGFDPDLPEGPLPSAAELVLDDLRWYLEGGHSPIRHEILDALLRFAKARGVTLPSAPEKCSIPGCTKDAVHRQEIGSGDVFLLCEEHHQAIFRATLFNAGGVERVLHVDFGIGDRSSSIQKTYGPLEKP